MVYTSIKSNVKEKKYKYLDNPLEPRTK
jgi:hypothetical protein